MKFFKGFIHAFQGIWEVTKSELNFKVHLIALSIVIGLGIYFNISTLEWILITLASGMVLAMEAINSSVEKVCDEMTQERKESIRIIKDIAAGAVLLSAIAAAIVGILIFWKYLF